tara:strand:- start:568 stop:1461 length:894 start_codon:yes stop_codon:yes gene_type:complete
MSIKVNNLSKSFYQGLFFNKSKKNILKNVSFKLDKGDIIGLIGSNGSGKTTLIKIILGLIEPDTGKIVIEERDKKYLGYVASNSRSFFWRLTPKDNLIFFGNLLNLPKKNIERKIFELAQNFGVEDLLEKPFMMLSSGQMQSFSAIRALLKRPDYLMLDEPTTSLDPKSSLNLIRELEGLINKYEIPTIWCSHDYGQLLQVCNKFAFINNENLEIIENKELRHRRELISNYSIEINKKDLKKLSEKIEIHIIQELNNSSLITQRDDVLSLTKFLEVLFKEKVGILSIRNNVISFEKT